MKYRKKPIVVEAMQLQEENAHDLISWAHAGFPPEANSILTEDFHGLNVRTLEGWVHAHPGDWVIKGIAGEFYPCKPDIFAATYEKVEQI